jgi:hypothetical protein
MKGAERRGGGEKSGDRGIARDLVIGNAKPNELIMDEGNCQNRRNSKIGNWRRASS